MSLSPLDDITSRRAFLGSCGVLTAGTLAAGAASRPAESPATRPADADEDEGALPKAVLGRTGVEITRIVMGASFPDYGPRLLAFAYQQGIRAFDNSHRYVGGNAEILMGEWLSKVERRDRVFVVTKRRTTDPDEYYQGALAALEKLHVDTIDLYHVHGLEDPKVSLDPRGEWRKVKERLIREKRIRFAGFSSHAPLPTRIECVKNAAKGGWIDAILLDCNPALIRANDELNKALDDCAKAGIGLMAMKTGRGLGDAPATQPADASPNPFAPLKLQPHHAMQVGIWSDERFTAVCTEMPSRRLIHLNCENARAFEKPFDKEQWKHFDEGAKRIARAVCPGCDGSCRVAGGTDLDLAAVARCVAYAEEDGKRDEARAMLADLLSRSSDHEHANLPAASRACHGHLAFEDIMRRARRLLA